MKHGKKLNALKIPEANLRDWTMFIILFFPISSMLKVYIGPLNVLLTGITFIMFFLTYLKNRITRLELLFLIYTVITLIYNIFLWGLEYYEDNMLFYFPFLLLYFGFCIRNSEYIIPFIRNHKQYLDTILLLWNGLVLISFILPGSYVYEGETRGFVSFAGTTFLLCAMAVYVFALLMVQYYLYKQRVYVFGLIIPSLCILMGTTRTYLVVLLCAWLVFLYINMKNKKWFVPAMAFGLLAFVLIVMVSPISEKFISAGNRSESLGMDPIEAFTSGRSLFWAYDMQSILSNSPIKIIFGNGVNWLFNLNRERFHNPLWAHNDYIQILSDYGAIGLSIYLWCIKRIINCFLKRKNISKILVGILIVMVNL